MRHKKKWQDANLAKHYGKGKVIKSQEAWFQQLGHPNSFIFSLFSFHNHKVIAKILHFSFGIIL